MTDTVRYLGACGNHGHQRELPRSFGKFVWVYCEAAGTTVSLHKLEATRTSGPCNAECMGATGPICSCGCGGANHGGAYREVPTPATEVISEDPELRKAFEWATEHKPDNDFVKDLTEKLSFDLAITERQHNAYIRTVNGIIKRDAEAKAETPKVDPPSGRVTFTAKVLGLREPDEYAEFPAWKMLVRVETGKGHYDVWMTVPSKLGVSDLRGATVTLKATLQPKEKGFAFGRRPMVLDYQQESLL